MSMASLTWKTWASVVGGIGEGLVADWRQRQRAKSGRRKTGADGVTVFPAVAPVRPILRIRIEWPSHHLDVYRLHDTPEYSVSGCDACGGSSRVSKRFGPVTSRPQGKQIR
jgi:hypothetical protein